MFVDIIVLFRKPDIIGANVNPVYINASWEPISNFFELASSTTILLSTLYIYEIYYLVLIDFYILIPLTLVGVFHWVTFGFFLSHGLDYKSTPKVR